MKTNNKWTVKDVITTVLLTVLLIGIHFVVITVSMVNQFFNCVLSPGVSMFFSAPVYMLMVSRVNKRFVSLTYLTILGVFFLPTGNLFRFGRPTMRGGTMEAGILSQRKEINLRMGDGEPVL
jgi:energy-coupling factor transport system substrate-specific component